MTTLKTAISIDADLLAWIKEEVAAGNAPSVSAYLANAAREKQASETADEFFAEILAGTGGPVTEEERSQARRRLGYA